MSEFWNDHLQPWLESLSNASWTIGKTTITLPGVLQVIATFFLLYLGARIVSRMLRKGLAKLPSLDAAQIALGDKLISLSVYTIAFFIGVDALGIDLTTLAVFSGALGLAIGFGLQKTFGNLFAGMILLMDRSIKPGDVITVDKTFGQVDRIGIRAVSVITGEGREYLIPNENLMTNEVQNWSYSSKNIRITVKVSIAYDSDIELARKLMFDAAHISPRVLKNPETVVWLTEFADNGIHCEIRLWIKDPENGVGNIRSAVMTEVLRSFREHGIIIPFPQREVYVHGGSVKPARLDKPSQSEKPAEAKPAALKAGAAQTAKAPAKISSAQAAGNSAKAGAMSETKPGGTSSGKSAGKSADKTARPAPTPSKLRAKLRAAPAAKAARPSFGKKKPGG